MMKQRVGSIALILFLSVPLCRAQTESFRKNFNLFREIAPRIDFFARSKSDLASFEKPVRDTRQKLASLVSRKLTKGAIVICSTMEQKDSVQEKSVLKLGYSWALIQLTPEATAQQRVAEIKARMGSLLPPGILERMQTRTPEQKAADDARMIGPMMQKMCFALLGTTLLPEKEFKSSRLDDLSRTPMADWLDLGIAWYASGNGLNLRFLQDRLEEVFPLEDVLSMPRPFVAPQGDGGSGGGQTIIRMGGNGAGTGSATAGMPPGGGQQGAVIYGGAPQQGGGGGRRNDDGAGGGSRGDGGGGGSFSMSLPKDMQDRMIFDSQATSLFSYSIQKLGLEKVKAVIESNLQGKLTREILSQPDFLGSDMDKIETDWRAWVKSQKPEEPAMNRMMMMPGKPPGPQP